MSAAALAELATKTERVDSVLITAAKTEQRLSELRAKRHQLSVAELVDGIDAAELSELDNEIAELEAVLREGASTVAAAVDAKAKLSARLSETEAELAAANREKRIARARELRAEGTAALREQLSALHDPLSKMIAGYRALSYFDVRNAGLDEGAKLLESLRGLLSAPLRPKWLTFYRHQATAETDALYYDLIGRSPPAPKAPKRKPVSVPIEIKGFHLPEPLEDPNPELGWPESGATLTDWALAFAERGWAVSTCVRNRHGDIVPDTNIAGELSVASDPKRIRAQFDSPSVIAVGFLAAKRLWIFDGRQVKKFSPTNYVGR